MNGITVKLDELIALRSSSAYFQSLMKKKTRGLESGGYLSYFKGRGLDFSESRVYQAGDDIRTIDWRVTARTGNAHTKVFHAEQERPVFIVTDFTQSMFFGTRVCFKSVLAAKIAALFAWRCDDQGDKVGGIVYNNHEQVAFTPLAKQAGVLPLLKALSLFSHQHHHEHPHDLRRLLSSLACMAKAGSQIIFISDFQSMSEMHRPYLINLSQRYDILAIQVYDILEREPPKPNRYGLTNGYQRMLLNTANQRVYQAYMDSLKKNQTTIQEILKKSAIPCLEISTDEDWQASLLTFLMRRL
jgi:uncharacterized protein (DUF58 family)